MTLAGPQPWRGKTRARLLHRKTTLAARCACLHFRHRPQPCGSLGLSAFLKRYCYVVAWWSSGRTRTATKSSRLFFSPLAHPQVPLVDVGKPAHHDSLHEGHQRGGPIWRPRRPLYSSRLFLNGVGYGPLFAEYVTQHKEESGKHQLIMTASMKVIRVVAPSGGPTKAWAAAGLEDEASSIQPAAS